MGLLGLSGAADSGSTEHPLHQLFAPPDTRDVASVRGTCPNNARCPLGSHPRGDILPQRCLILLMDGNQLHAATGQRRRPRSHGHLLLAGRAHSRPGRRLPLFRGPGLSPGLLFSPELPDVGHRAAAPPGIHRAAPCWGGGSLGRGQGAASMWCKQEDLSSSPRAGLQLAQTGASPALRCFQL